MALKDDAESAMPRATKVLLSCVLAAATYVGVWAILYQQYPAVRPITHEYAAAIVHWVVAHLTYLVAALICVFLLIPRRSGHEARHSNRLMSILGGVYEEPFYVASVAAAFAVAACVVHWALDLSSRPSPLLDMSVRLFD